MSESMLDKIATAPNFYYYNLWANGADGSISDYNGTCVFRFFKANRDSKGDIIDETKDFDNSPIVAIGIVAYWLHYRSCKNPLSRLIAPPPKEPQPFLKIFNDYKEIRLKEYKKAQEEDPSSWRRDIEREFYTNYTIPFEERLNKTSEALFEYLNPEDQQLVKKVMEEYILFLKQKKKDFFPHDTASQRETKSKNNRNVNVEKLEMHFNTKFDKQVYIPILKELLEHEQSDKDLARAALIIFQAETFIKKDYNGVFTKWYKDFCDIVQCKFHKDYVPSALYGDKFDKLKEKTYYFL